jgi:hypothetical protein
MKGYLRATRGVSAARVPEGEVTKRIEDAVREAGMLARAAA